MARIHKSESNVIINLKNSINIISPAEQVSNQIENIFTFHGLNEKTVIKTTPVNEVTEVELCCDDGDGQKKE